MGTWGLGNLTKFIRICIHKKFLDQIYLYSNSLKISKPNIFVFVFGQENQICHTLIKVDIIEPPRPVDKQRETSGQDGDGR